MFSFAEILFTIAEVENEVNRPADKAFEAINFVRNGGLVAITDVTLGLRRGP
ncbi:hypothetical protein QSE00_12625 [Arenibacter sp. M-2]|uniref:RagB/SusD family nutrient uptake outer membrane protein n=1 Tax=unclassified Arenibacter TaxID=2615047 RepID=UPI0011B73410|nr:MULTISPECIES: RagB/SusD family nutrient uptake outer membrane protein [unclassified Arenibacter]MDL5512666.1 hypothetical protein [Arenibacter sp. M-2]